MEAEQSLTFRLETYLVRLGELNRRWTDWLAEGEMAAVAHEQQRLQALQSSAAALFQELEQIISDRQQLLNDAEHLGWPAGDLTSLAQQLPAWSKPAVRQSLSLARSQLANLRRLHVAAWVLISQAYQFYSDSLQLLMVGNQPHVYQQGLRVDTEGGRLLDASL